MARQRLAAVGLTTQASCGWNCSNGPAIPAIPANALPERSTSFGASGEGRDDAPSLGRSTYAAGVLNLSDKQMQKLVSACRTHTDGMTSSDPTIGVCFDADRLDLSRVGIRPELSFLSTDAAKRKYGLDYLDHR